MTKNTPSSRGILLVALGAPEYGDMAANLAASIRYNDKDVAIHLVHTAQSIAHFAPAHRALFTSFGECPTEYYTRAEEQEASDVNSPPPTTRPQSPVLEYIKAKTHLYDLTPFEETLFLDVDMYILPHTRMSDVIDGLSAVCEYTIKNRGYQNLSGTYTHWFNVDLARKHFKTKGRFYQSQSEFIFFKKTKKNAAFFKKVRQIFDTRPIPCDDFRGSASDEYAYNIAMAVTETYPHAERYIPIYWYFLDGHTDWNKSITKNYIGFSLGGDLVPGWLAAKVRVYKQFYKESMNLPYLFNVPPKRRWNKQKGKVI